MHDAPALASQLVNAHAAGIGPTDIGWVREGGHERGGHPVTATLSDGRTVTLYACSSCATPWPMARGLQACHVVPARDIIAHVEAVARVAGLDARTLATLKRWARRYAHPANVVPGCYACNDDHEQR